MALVAALTAGGCATAPAAQGPAAPSADPLAVHWTRTAAEHSAVFLQTFALAAERVQEMAAGLAEGRWAVVLDGDETVLDNSEYQRRRARAGLGFTLESWLEWVREESAPALPGSAGFIDRVRDLGGRVVIVTNRDEEVCDPTRRNFEALRIEVDLVLCRVNGQSEKDTRYRAVEAGSAATGLPPLRIVAWVGDNIEDFPGGSQAWRQSGQAVFQEFGSRFFVLPNPMYGSWERNAPSAAGGPGPG